MLSKGVLAAHMLGSGVGGGGGCASGGARLGVDWERQDGAGGGPLRLDK